MSSDRGAAAATTARPQEVPPDTPADRLRQLARAIECLAVAGRTDPETIAITKQLIARDLRRLAMELS